MTATSPFSRKATSQPRKRHRGSAFIAFPGAATGAQAALRLYAVSENWLTGGDGGLICGAWMTLVLLALAAWLLRKPMRTLWQQMAARRESAKTKKH